MDGGNIVLTGANSGIGLETLRLLSENNRILAVDLNTDGLNGFSDNVIPYVCDISVRENVDSMFAYATELFGTIDVVIANAGYMRYERFEASGWDEMERMFRTNTISVMYTYQKYIEHLDGRDGVLAITVSAMGRMGMPAFTLYSSTKAALDRFQESVRLEKPDNLTVTCLYPVSTDTAFFYDGRMEKPYPVQTPDLVAAKFVKGIEKRKRTVNPCRMFVFASGLFRILPFTRRMYWKREGRKFLRYEERLKERSEPPG